jgi:MFS family permease
MDGLGGEVSSVKSIAPLGSISVPLVRVTETQLAVVAASLGTIFEWYDFFLYATLAVFFSALFFPPGNETAALLASLATFGAGFAVRPFGALIFGALGDRIGRKRTFMVTMVMMGFSTVVIGLLPTYAQVGVWAPVLLVFMRLTQGLAVGGEYGGAAAYVA